MIRLQHFIHKKYIENIKTESSPFQNIKKEKKKVKVPEMDMMNVAKDEESNKNFSL